MVAVPRGAMDDAVASEAETACRLYTKRSLQEEAPRVEQQLAQRSDQHAAELQALVASAGLTQAVDVRAAADTLAGQVVAAMEQHDSVQAAEDAELAQELANRRTELAATTDMSSSSAAAAVLMVGVAHDVSAYIASEAMLQSEEQARLAVADQEESERRAQQLRADLLQHFESAGAAGGNSNSEELATAKAAVADLVDQHAERQRQVRDAMKRKMADRKVRRLARLDGMQAQELEAELAEFEQTSDIAVEHRDAARQALRQKVGMRHRAQRAAAVTQMEAEESQAMAAVLSTMAREEVAELQQLAQVHLRRALEVKYSPADADRILADFATTTRATEARLDESREQGAKELQARLLAIRKRKQKEQQRKAIDDAAALAVSSESMAAEGTLLVPVVDLSAAAQREVEALQRQQERNESQMRSQHAQELDTLYAKAQAELLEEQRKAEAAFEGKKQQILREREQRMAADRAARTGLTTDESERLLKQHAQELEALEGKLTAEQQRSQAAIKEKLEARKRQREQQLRKKQEADVCREQLVQGRELAETVSEQLREAEFEAIAVGLQQNKHAPADEVVRLVLAQRHSREQQELDRQYDQERAISVHEVLEQLAGKHNAQRERLEGLHADEQADILDDVVGLSSEQLDDQRAQMLNRQQVELREQAQHFAAEVARAERDAVAALDIRYAEQRLQLIEQQYQDVATALQRLGNEAQSANSAQAQAAAAELERVRMRLEEEKLAEVARLEAEQRALEEAEEERVTSELQALDEQLAEQRRLDQEAVTQEMTALEARKQQIIEERRKKKLQHGPASDEEKNAILKQYEEDTLRLCTTVDAEKNRQEKALELRLRQKRDRQRAVKEQKLRTLVAQTSPRAGGGPSELAQVVQQAAAITAPAVERTRRASLMIERRRSIDSLPVSMLSPRASPGVSRLAMGGVAEDHPVNDEEMMRTIGATQMLSRLEKIESLLTGPSGSVGGAYADERDRLWTLVGTAPAVCAPEALSPRQYIVYRFGLFLQEMLVRRRGHGRVAVVVASALPVHAPYTGNAFCNSVFFDAATSTLCVRQERLESVGEYALVLAHALAHVHIGSMVADSDPAFMYEFHRCLHALCEDSFAMRVPAGPDALPSAISSSTADRDAAVSAAANFSLP